MRGATFALLAVGVRGDYLKATIFADSNCYVSTNSISVVAPSGCFVLPSAVSSGSTSFKSVSVTCGSSGAFGGTSIYSTMAYTDRQCTQTPTPVTTVNQKLFAAVPQPSCTDNALYPNFYTAYECFSGTTAPSAVNKAFVANVAPGQTCPGGKLNDYIQGPINKCNVLAQGGTAWSYASPFTQVEEVTCTTTGGTNGQGVQSYYSGNIASGAFSCSTVINAAPKNSVNNGCTTTGTKTTFAQCGLLN